MLCPQPSRCSFSFSLFIFWNVYWMKLSLSYPDQMSINFFHISHLCISVPSFVISSAVAYRIQCSSFSCIWFTT